MMPPLCRDLASLLGQKFAIASEPPNQEASSLFAVACSSPPSVAGCDELRGQDFGFGHRRGAVWTP
jgi:hypothetical protein